MSDLTPMWIVAGCLVWLVYTIALAWWFSR